MKKKEELELKQENPKIKPDMYWEWRCTIEELKNAKINEKRVHLEKELKQKEIEINKLRLAVFRETVASARRSAIEAEKEYEKMKQRIEDEIGMSLNGCVIDDISYEVKKLEEEESN